MADIFEEDEKKEELEKLELEKVDGLGEGESVALADTDADLEVSIAPDTEDVTLPGDKVDDKADDPDGDGKDEVEAASDPKADEITTDEAEELDPDDRKNYSRKVQKRILRERRIARDASEEADKLRDVVFQERSRTHEVATQMVSVLASNVERELKAALADLTKAKEAGDSAEDSRLTGEIAELQAKKREIEAAKNQLSNEKPVREVRAPTGEAARWKERNRWYEHPRFTAESTYVALIDKKLAAEGRLRVGSPEYFRELDARVKRELPDLGKKASAVFRAAAPAPADKRDAQRRSPVASVPKGGSGAQQRPAAAGKSRVTLTQADLETMRTFKLDPTNKEHIAAFARQKLETQ